MLTSRPDLIIMAVTSQLRSTRNMSDVELNDWQAAGLLKPSAIKPVIATIECTLVVKRLGRLKEDDQQKLRAAITKIVG